MNVPAELKKMFHFCFLLSFISFSGLLSSCATPSLPEASSISVDELNQIPVIGRLGVPMGDVALVKAVLVTDKQDAFDGDYLLEVTQVNGKPCEPPILFPFEIHLSQPTRTEEGGFFFFFESMSRPHQRFLGDELILQVYELGCFSGSPRGLPFGSWTWKGREYHFSSRLRIVYEMKVH